MLEGEDEGKGLGKQIYTPTHHKHHPDDLRKDNKENDSRLFVRHFVRFIVAYADLLFAKLDCCTCKGHLLQQTESSMETHPSCQKLEKREALHYNSKKKNKIDHP